MCENIARLDEAVLNLIARTPPVLTSALHSQLFKN